MFLNVCMDVCIDRKKKCLGFKVVNEEGRRLDRAIR